MKVAFFTLGCKVNQYESQVLMQQFQNNGFEVVGSNENADVYIINSCTVTSIGTKKTRQVVNRARGINKKSIIVLTGCFPQAFPEEASKISEADIVTGTTQRNNIYNLVVEKLSKKNGKNIHIVPNGKKDIFENMALNKFQGKTRAFVKIEDGCNRFCSYCIIPMARGRVRSKKLDDIKKEINVLAKNGHKEIVLTGINLSSYGQDIDLNLVDVVESISEISDVKRIRLSSLEPELLTLKDLERLSKLEKFCPQFHLCLQSGCDETLKRMNRQYNTKEYYEIVQLVRKNINNPSITTDLMVGFPGETDDEFSQTFEFIKKVQFARMHVFSYSKREKTRAAIMPNQIESKIKQKRNLLISQLALKMQTEFLKSQIGLTNEVLFETYLGDNLYQGYSKNYSHVVCHSKVSLLGKVRNVVFTDIEEGYCKGNLDSSC